MTTEAAEKLRLKIALWKHVQGGDRKPWCWDCNIEAAPRCKMCIAYDDAARDVEAILEARS